MGIEGEQAVSRVTWIKVAMFEYWELQGFLGQPILNRLEYIGEGLILEHLNQWYTPRLIFLN